MLILVPSRCADSALVVPSERIRRERRVRQGCRWNEASGEAGGRGELKGRVSGMI